MGDKKNKFIETHMYDIIDFKRTTSDLANDIYKKYIDYYRILLQESTNLLFITFHPSIIYNTKSYK